ncbi:hypothetical protein CU097_005341, partial [Rhizopus azygosporus]
KAVTTRYTIDPTYGYSTIMPEDRDQKRHRYKVGTLALSAVILIWVSSSFVMNVRIHCMC